MKTIIASFFLFLFSFAAQAAPPSYAGTWLLDLPASSSMPEPYRQGIREWRLAVEQTAKVLNVKIHIEREGMDPIEEVHPHNLDGTPNTFDTTARTPNGPMTVPMTSLGRVDADGTIHLFLSGEMKGPTRTIKRSIEETLRLSEDGKTLTIHRKDDGPVQQEFDMVFRRAAQ